MNESVEKCIRENIDLLEKLINELDEAYKKSKKSYGFSEFEPRLRETAKKRFGRQGRKILFFISEEDLKESMARSKAEPLPYYPNYFKNEVRKLKLSLKGCYHEYVLLSNLYNAIDDIRIWGATYIEMTGQKCNRNFMIKYKYIPMEQINRAYDLKMIFTSDSEMS